jgi:hypothetical protein
MEFKALKGKKMNYSVLLSVVSKKIKTAVRLTQSSIYRLDATRSYGL